MKKIASPLKTEHNTNFIGKPMGEDAAASSAGAPTLADILYALKRQPLIPGEQKRERRRREAAVRAVAKVLGQKPQEINAEPNLFLKIELSAGSLFDPDEVRRYRIDFQQALRISGLIPILPLASLAFPKDWAALRAAATHAEWKLCSHLVRYLILQGCSVADIPDGILSTYVEDHAQLIVWATARDIALNAIKTLNVISQRRPNLRLRHLDEIPGRRIYKHPSVDLYPSTFWSELRAYRTFLLAPPPKRDPCLDANQPDGEPKIDNRTKQLARGTADAHETDLRFLAAAYVWGGGDPKTLQQIRDLAAEDSVGRIKAGMALYTGGQKTTRCSGAFNTLLLAARFWRGMAADKEMIGRLEEAYFTHTPTDRIQTQSTRDAITVLLDMANIKRILSAPRQLWTLAPTTTKGTEALALQQAAVAVRLITIVPQWISDLTHLEVGASLILPQDIDEDTLILGIRNETASQIIRPKFARLLCDYEAIRQNILADAGIKPDSERHLFLTTRGHCKTNSIVSSQITDGLQRVTGLRLTLVQLRFFAAILSLHRNPKDKETARRLLHHKDSATTEARLKLAIQSIGSKSVANAIADAAGDLDFGGDADAA